MKKEDAIRILVELDIADKIALGEKKNMLDERLKSIPTIDELEFKLREDIMACACCRNVRGVQDSAGYLRDRHMYKHVAKMRNLLKRDRIRIEDLSDDLESPKVKRRNQTEAEAKEDIPDDVIKPADVHKILLAE
jgi:hypothetical protein